MGAFGAAWRDGSGRAEVKAAPSVVRTASTSAVEFQAGGRRRRCLGLTRPCGESKGVLTRENEKLAKRLPAHHMHRNAFIVALTPCP